MKTVLVPFNHRPVSRDALEHAFEEYAEDGRDVMIHAIYFNNHDEDAAVSAYKKKVNEFAEEHGFNTDRLEVSVEVRDEDTENPRKVGRMILDYIENHSVDSVVMGQDDKDLKDRILKGSASSKVTDGSPVPVTVVSHE